MESNNNNNTNKRESGERRKSNTEYVPTKCRVTKPPPPQPATNPSQFIKIAPSTLFLKAHEQIKKVEQVKKERKEVRDEAEDWQQNLDNWKSSRRKRQEDVIERVVQVKKLEQEEHERSRRKSKTFNEMIEERANKGRQKFNIPVYDDESNDLSDYGIGSSSSKTNSIKDNDTDDSSSMLDDKDQVFESTCNSNKDNSSVSNQSQSEDELLNDHKKRSIFTDNNNDNNDKSEHQYTYESAIQGYRSRIRSKILVDESIFAKTQDIPNQSKELSEAQVAIPKGEICKRKELFEGDKKTMEIHNYESLASRRLSEDFVNTQSIKERLESLEKCTDQATKAIDKIERFELNDKPPKISNYLVQPPIKSSGVTKIETGRCSSPETELYMDQLNLFSKDLDLLHKKTNGSDDYHQNYAPSTSSIEVKDRDDSTIHTADVSCQADESPIEKPKEIPFSHIKEATIQLLKALQRDSSENLTKIEPKPVKSQPAVAAAIYENIVFDHTFPLAPPTIKEPPKVKPPPPPPHDDDNSTKRIKREMHIKRSSFLGLEEPTDEQIYPEIAVNKPPDINSFLVKGTKTDNGRMGILSRVESHDSGLDIDRGRLSSDTWCTSSIGDSATPSPERHDSEQTNSITSEEDEITKKEREIIETVEKEEKSRDSHDKNQVISKNKQNCMVNEPFLASESLDDPYFTKKFNYLPTNQRQDCQVLKVEHGLLQLEYEEFERQRENRLFKESRMKARLQSNRHSTENLCDAYRDGVTYRKLLFGSDLQRVPIEYRKSLPDVPNAYNNFYRLANGNKSSRGSGSGGGGGGGGDSEQTNGQYRKSLPDIQFEPNKRQPILAGKPLRPTTSKERFMMMNPGKSDALPLKNRQYGPCNSSFLSKTRINWLQPRAKPQTKSYNQHWLYQEAEIRRISDAEARRPKQDNKPLPDSVIQTIHERIQNREAAQNSPNKSSGKDDTRYMKHALPVPYGSQNGPEDGQQDRMLSVSGKKKCSYCNVELGHGAAMIIESLCLFYHMKCFKCCVCRTQLVDGLNGTDVRVRNQKLHCHNCYSSDDGIKFSRV